MRAALLAVASLGAAVVHAQTSGDDWHTTTLEYSNGTSLLTTTYTYQYDNPATSYLTQTDSNGVVTGLPTAAGQSGQTAVATIPAGLPTGVTSVPYNLSGSVTWFTVSVGSSTTYVVGGDGAGVTVEGSSGAGATIIATATDSTETGGASPTASGSSQTSSGAADSVKAASAGVFGLGAFLAILL